MQILSVSWNPELDKTVVHYNKHFLASHWIVKLDVIQDSIHELDRFYNASFPKDEEMFATILGHEKEEI